MKSFKFFIIAGIAMFFCIGCKDRTAKPEYAEPDFGKEIKADISTLNTDFLFSYGSLKVIDSLIIYSGVSDISDKTFHVFSKNTGAYITSFGNIGRAQNEVSQPAMGFTLDKERKILYVFDNPQRKTVAFSLEKIIAGANDYAREVKLPSCVANVRSKNFLYLNNSFLAGYTYNDRFLACTENDSITSSNIYPKLDEPSEYKNVEESYFLFTANMAAKPDGCKFVHATSSGCILEIWNFDGKNLKQETVKRFIKPDYEVRDRDMPYPMVIPKSTVPGIMSVACSDQHIYANYNDVTPEPSGTIAVFDWKGSPKKKYLVGKKILAFDADGDDAVYALVIDADENIELIKILS